MIKKAFLLALLISLSFSTPIMALDTEILNGSLRVKVDNGHSGDVEVVTYGTAIPTLHGRYSGGTIASPQQIPSGQLLFGLGATPWTGSNYTSHSTAAIHFSSTENITNSNQGTMIRFIVTPNGSTHANRIIAAQITDKGFLQHKAPSAQVYKSSSVGNQSISNATYSSISFDGEDWDNNNLHGGTYPTRFYAPVSGKYRATSTVAFSGNTNGDRVIVFRKNGNANDRFGYQASRAAGGIQSVMTTTTTFDLSQGDFIETYAWQSSGGNLDIVAEGAAPQGISRMTLEYIGN